MEQTEARTRNPATPERQLEVAQSVSEWFVPYLYGIDLETDVSLPRRTRARMTAIVGKYPTPQLLSRIREVFANVPPDQAHNTVLYLAGYPDEALTAMADGDMATTVRFLESAGEQYRPVVPEKAVARRALKETLQLDGELDNPESVDDAVDDDAAPELLDVKLSDDPVRDYLRIIGKYPLLNAEEEVIFSSAIEAGLFAHERKLRLVEEGADPRSIEIRELSELERIGARAKERMINSNLRLVVNLSKRYVGRGMQLLDLIQEGNLGLIHAVERFDYTKGFKFSTYATWWIRQSLQRNLADKGREIRIPVHMVEKLNTKTRVSMELTQLLERKPTDEELAAELDITVDRLRKLQEYDQRPISLNMKVGDDGSAEFGELIGDDGAANPENMADTSGLERSVEKLFATLNERDAAIVRRRFGIGGAEKATLDTIASEMGVTRERIRQIEVRAMATLRRVATDNQELREYLS